MRRSRGIPAREKLGARPDFHDPTAGVGGAPPASSALALRLVLALFGIVVMLALGVVALVVHRRQATEL